VNLVPPILQIRLFGQPQLREDSGPLSFRASTSALTLLVYLLLHRDELSARDAVALLFWPDLPESEARAKLRYEIRNLRVALPPGEISWILADTRTVRWNPDAAIRLDVAEFERLAAQPETAAAAVDLYKGDLAGPLDTEWLLAPRERLRELQSQLLWGLVEASRARSDRRLAIDYAQRLLQHDPWRENAIRVLIELRNDSGDRAGALQTYCDFVERLKADLGVEPMPETTAVYNQVAAAIELHSSATLRTPNAPTAGQLRHNLPVALTTFVGREDDVDALRALLEKRRLVTLIGTGGVGKTRLAIETTRELVERFSDGVWLVELAPLADPALVISTIANSLGLQNPSESTALEMLRGKHILLVLDNCEHLIVDAARIVERLLLECPRMHVLATSREPLRCLGERTERVVSLALPARDQSTFPSLEKLKESAAVRLFLDRAADVAPAISIRCDSEVERLALATIARRLDGIPLAIEFAAARTSSLSLEALAKLLDDRYTLLTAGKRTALPRQQTLRATLDWSYDLLTPVEQCLLARTAIFSGGWTLKALGAVCSDGAVPEQQIIDVLTSLVDKSLVVMDFTSPEARYHLLETTRAYALERLVQNAEHGRITRLHAEYYLILARSIDNTWHPSPAGGIEQFLLELDNFRAALTWAIDAKENPGLGASLIAALRGSFATQSLNDEEVRWCERTITVLGANPEPDHEAAVQLALAGSMGTFPFFPRFHYYRSGTVERFLAAAERAAELLRAIGDGANCALALSLAALHLRLAREARAVTVAEDAVAVSRDSRKPLAIAMARYAQSFAIDQSATTLRMTLLSEALDLALTVSKTYCPSAVLHALGEAAFESGDPINALSYAQRCAEIEFSAPVYPAQARINIAAYSLILGRIDDAHANSRQALAVAQRIGEPMLAGAAFQHLAGVAATRGDVERAGRLLGASNARRDGMPIRLFTEQTAYDWTISQMRESNAKENVDRLMREGYTWSVDYAIDQAMAV
jgi:predicted ATPase/DNA-binding SARP family transcriptional activator